MKGGNNGALLVQSPYNCIMMNRSFNIGDIRIGSREEIMVIPEMGINHEGSLEVAKLIVDAAARAGARIIKHQTHVVEDEMSQMAKRVIPVHCRKKMNMN
mgnify:CR=1 FL=1